MVHLSFRWWVWLLALFAVYVTYRGPSASAWTAMSILHGVAAAGGAVAKGLAGLQHCGHACRPH